MCREALAASPHEGVAALPVWGELQDAHEPVDAMLVSVEHCEELVPGNHTYKVEMSVAVQVRAASHDAAAGEALLKAAQDAVELVLLGADGVPWRGRELDALGCAATVLDLFYGLKPLSVLDGMVRYAFEVRLYVQF